MAFRSLFRRSHFIHPGVAPTALKKVRAEVEDLLKRRFFLRPSFEIYDGVSGLYDYGPPGCAVKHALEASWRRQFVLEDDMLEVSCSVLTPEQCLKASGHVDRFTDFVVREDTSDGSEGKSYRADKLIEDYLNSLVAEGKLTHAETAKMAVGAMTAQQLWEVISKYDIRAPGTKHKLTFPEPFNLMFATEVGPTRKLKAFLRPETAQGIFVNFKHLYEQNGGKLPFAAAQIGTGFRNEISPRDGLLRVREFAMAEIEHFAHPKSKSHPKYPEVCHNYLHLLPRSAQSTPSPPAAALISAAVEDGTIANETLAYYMSRAHSFLLSTGIPAECIRFRQHLSTEMSHYAADCWDAEVFSSFGWVECVGIADRHCYDLQQHAKASKKNLCAAERCHTAKTVETVDLRVNKAKVGASFKAKAQGILARLAEMSEEAKAAVLQDLESSGAVKLALEDGEVVLTPAHLSPAKLTKKVTQEQFFPSVIEPSFGISRILYSLLEHSYRQRAEDSRGYLSLPPHLAPVKCSLLPLSSNSAFQPLLAQLRRSFLSLDIATETDDSGVSIGRRYARTDEVGIPFAVTVDFQSAKDGTVTLREVNTMQQYRVPAATVAEEVQLLVRGKQRWSDLGKKFAVVTNQ